MTYESGKNITDVKIKLYDHTQIITDSKYGFLDNVFIKY